jgi:hypothetical protein
MTHDGDTCNGDSALCNSHHLYTASYNLCLGKNHDRNLKVYQATCKEADDGKHTVRCVLSGCSWLRRESHGMRCKRPSGTSNSFA